MSTPGSPNPDLGDAPVPPYDKDEGTPQESPISKSSGKTGPVYEGRIVTDEEKGGVGDADMEPEAALNVGGSINARGEEQGGGIGQSSQGSGGEGRKGASGRPTGTHGDETSVSESADDKGMGQST